MFKSLEFFKRLLFIGLFMLPGCGNNASFNTSDTLVVGTNSGFPPYETLDEQGNLQGLDIDIANELAVRLGKKIVFKDMAFDGLIIGLKQNKIDLILAGMSITKQRLEEITMVHYIGDADVALLFWQQPSVDITCMHDLAQLDKKIVSVQSGTIQDEIASKYAFLEVRHLENVADLVMDMKFGKSTAALVDAKAAKLLQKENPELVVVPIDLKDEKMTFGHGIGINKDNKTLIEQISTAIAGMKQDGTIKKITTTWMGDEHDVVE